MTTNDVFSMSENVSFELVGDLSVLMLNDSGEVLSCNQTMTAFLNELDGALSIEDVANRLQQRFAARPERIVEDLLSAAGELNRKGIIERV